MTREELQTLLESDQETGDKITAILNRFHARIKEEVAAESESEKKRADSLDQQLKESQKTLKTIQRETKDNDELQRIIEENKNTIESLKQELSQSRLNSAVDLAVAKSGAKNSKIAEMVKHCIDLDKVKIADDGSISGIEEQIKAMKEDEETSPLFMDSPEKSTHQSYTPQKGEEAKEPSLGIQRALEYNKAHSGSESAFEKALG